MDIIHETNSLMSSIIFTCTYGRDIGQDLIEISIGGKKEIHTITYSIEYLVSYLILRSVSLKYFLFPDLVNYSYTAEEREQIENCRKLRSKIKEILEEKL